jgi:hypothetical protein
MIAAAVSRTLDRSTGTAGVTSAALGAAGVCLAFAGFQVALAVGAPFGEHVWGGTQQRVLPVGMRVVAGGSAIALTAMAAIVARRAGLVGRPARWLTPATWAIACFLSVNTVGNLASTSFVERFVFAPATAVAAALTAVVAHRTRRR